MKKVLFIIIIILFLLIYNKISTKANLAEDAARSITLQNIPLVQEQHTYLTTSYPPSVEAPYLPIQTKFPNVHSFSSYNFFMSKYRFSKVILTLKRRSITLLRLKY